MSCLLSSSDTCCSVSPVQGPCNFTLQNQLFQRKFFSLAKSGFQKCWLCDETAVKIIQNFPSLIPLDVFLSTKVLYQHNPGFWGGRCLSGLGVGSDWWVEKLFVLFSCRKTSVLFFAFRSMALNWGIFNPSKSCNSGSWVSVFKGLAYPNFLKDSLSLRSASLCL